MQRKTILKLCMCFVLAVTAAFTLGGCTESKLVADDNETLTPATVAVNASNDSNDNKHPSRLQSIQDKVSVQHR